MDQSVFALADEELQRGVASLVAAVEHRIAALIERGTLRPGDRLPATRELAAAMRINRGVLLKAVRRLEARGLLRTRVGSGITVAGGASGAPARALEGPRPSAALARLEEEGAPPAAGAAEPTVADFSRLAPDPRFFPREEFIERLAEAMRGQPALWQYAPPFGLPALREEIARRLRSRGAPWSAEEILITAGAQQALDLLFRAFVDPGDAVAVESPTYPGVKPLLRFYAARVVELPVRHDGSRDLSALAGRPASLLYTMPDRHNPTGVTMPEGARRGLLAAAEEAGALVVEDGYETPPPGTAPLSTLARERVAGVGSFSKELAPGFRVGWIAAPGALLARLAPLKQMADFQTPLPLQAALAAFLAGGRSERWQEERARATASRRRALMAALARSLPELPAPGGDPGSAVAWLSLPPGVSGREAARRAASAGVLVAAGAEFDPRGRDVAALRLSVSQVEEAAIGGAVALLAQAIRAAAQAGRAALPIRTV